MRFYGKAIACLLGLISTVRHDSHALVGSGVCLSPSVIIVVIIEVAGHAIAISSMPFAISIVKSKN